jgi:ABC-type antimicrobial peptide transport system permease subunit
MRGSAWILATGMTLGLALAVGIAMTAASLLIGISPLDPPTFLGASLAMAAVGLLASFLPARRAAAANPLASLRAD